MKSITSMKNVVFFKKMWVYFFFFFSLPEREFFEKCYVVFIFHFDTGNLPYQSSFVQDAVSLARAEDEAEAAARKLTEAAFNRGSADNITCIVVRLHHEKAKAKANPANSESDKAGPASSQPE